MGTMWGPLGCGDHMGITWETTWGQCGDHGDVETTWGQHEDNVETTWAQCGDHGDVEDHVGTNVATTGMWRPRGDNMETTWGQHEDNVETTWGQIM